MANLFNIPGLTYSGGPQLTKPVSFGTFNQLPGLNLVRSGGDILGTSTTKKTGGGGGGGSSSSSGSAFDISQYAIPSGPSEEDLNAIFAGAYSALDEQQRALEGQQPITYQEIEQAGQGQIADYNQMLQKGMGLYEGQETGTRKQEQDAYSQARNLFNELAQAGLSRFGSGSSAGQAAGEILGRSTQQQFGNISNIATQNLQKINQARTELSTYVNDSVTKVKKDVDLQMQKAKQWYTDRINEINASRAGLASDKAQKKYEALQARENFIADIKNRAADYELQLKNWKEQQDMLMEQSIGAYQYGDVDAENIANQANQFQQTAPRMQESAYSPNLFQNSVYLGGKLPAGLTPDDLAQLKSLGMA